MARKSKASRSADAFTARLPQASIPATGPMPGVMRLGKPGALLICRILEEGGRRGLTKEELGQEALGVQRSYFSSLCAGDKDVPGLGEDAITKAARFLGIARVTAKLLAGQLSDADFYCGPSTYEDALRLALRLILDDPQWAAPLSILSADIELQSFVVHLYERATRRRLIPGKLTQHDVIEQHRALMQEQEHAAESSETATDYDRVLRACRESGITLRSPRLRNGTIVDALGLAIHGPAWSSDSARKNFHVGAAVRLFASELKLLDSINPQPDPFHTGLVAAALLSLSLDPSTLEFFARLSEARSQGGTGGISTALSRLLLLVSRVRKRGAKWNSALAARELCATALQAVDAWKRPTEDAVDPDAAGLSPNEWLTRAVERVRAHKAAHSAGPG